MQSGDSFSFVKTGSTTERTSAGEEAGVDDELGAGDEAGFVGGEVEDGVGDVFGLDPGDWQ